MRTILSIIAGFIVWSVIWVTADAVLRTAWTSYDESIKGMTFNSVMLIIPLVLSVTASIISGYVTAVTARENTRSTLILGIVLFIVGLLVQISVWDKIPLWYHLAFLILLIPATVFGGKLNSKNKAMAFS